jgi:hypothetical protein
VHAALPPRQRSLAGVPVEHLEHGATLPGGIVAYGAGRDDERAIWIASHGALVVGDAMLGTEPDGLAVCPANWLPGGVTRAAVADAFARLLHLDISHVIPAHGPAPSDPAAAFTAAVEEARSPAPEEAR